jgi:hypothetical protein
MTTIKLRTAPEGAKAPKVPAPPQMPTMVDVTPTWSAILPMLLAVYENGNFHGVREAEGELRRMAELADRYVASQKAKEAQEGQSGVSTRGDTADAAGGADGGQNDR